MLLLLSCAPRLTQAETALHAEHVALVEAFAQRADQVGFTVPAPRPVVAVKTTPRLVSYKPSAKGGTLYLPRWSEATPELVGLLGELSGDCEGWSEQQLYAELFHWFFGPHELGHALQAALWSGTGRYERELEANRIAVAWWEEHEPERLERLVGCLEGSAFVEGAEDPGPAWFDEHYRELVRSPRGYAQFQFDMVVVAYEQREQHSLESLVLGVHDGRFD
jgi:hypothetical protein